MIDDKKFESKGELEAWLKLLGVDEDDAGEAAEKLFERQFNKASRLFGITVEELGKDVNILNPLARELSNKLKAQQPQQNGKKKARICFSFDDSLPKPYDVIPPKSTKPEFVAPDGWLEEIELEIVAQMVRSDDLVGSNTEDYFGETETEHDGDETLERVAPMAVVRCSRGGKTRALYEIANKIRGYNQACQANIAVLYVSFNDYSSLQPWEQENPLQALLRRIVFMASHNDGKKRSIGTFEDFANKKQHIDQKDFLKWLGDSNSTPCVLIVDELNNLIHLSKKNSPAATEFAKFVKRYFIAIQNRYFVYSSHQVSTLEYFSFFVDPSRGSVRSVVLQELPIADTLSKALKLNSHLDSAREAIYYGLLPGLIYESTSVRSIVGKRETFTRDFLSESQNLDEDFMNILRSLLSGTAMLVPKQLHMILDTAGNENGPSVIRWVPFHLSFVLSSLATANAFSYRLIANHMEKLCNNFRDSKRFSGEGWEGIFVLFLLARCLTGSCDEYFVPSKWFLENPKVLFNAPYQSNEQRLFSACENWEQLLKSVTPGAEPQLSILFPTHSRFATYDVLAVYSKDGQNKSIYGYQLKEGTASTANFGTNGIERRFWVQGKSPKNAKSKQNWEIPGKAFIDNFYGESGKHWTPEQWRKFEATK